MGRPATQHTSLASVWRGRTRELEASASRAKSPPSATHAAAGEGVSGGGRDGGLRGRSGVREVRGRSGVQQEAGMRVALSAASRMDGGSSKGAVVREDARTGWGRQAGPALEAAVDRRLHHSRHSATLPPPPALRGGHEKDVERLVSTLAKEVTLDTQGAQTPRSS